MVAHQRGEHAEGQPAQQQLPVGVAAEAADVRADVEEATHIQRRHLAHGHPQIFPAGGVVAGPDSAVAVGADVAGAGEQQVAVLHQLLQLLTGGSGHQVAVGVVDIVMEHLPAVDVVVEIGVVHQIDAGLVIIIAAGDEVLFLGGGGILAVEDGRLVHVIPEALHSLIGVEFVLAAEPLPGLGPEEVGEVGHAGPDRRLEVAAFLVFAEVVARNALFVDRVAPPSRLRPQWEPDGCPDPSFPAGIRQNRGSAWDGR